MTLFNKEYLLLKSVSSIFVREVLKNDKDNIMLAYTYVEPGKFELQEKLKPGLKDSRDAIVRVTLGSICTSDLHIKHGSVPHEIGRAHV